jgi:23S rRNA pseudouridine2605 synthase
MKRKTDNFSKFYNKKRNSAIKEEFRQEKKAAKKERKEAIERRFEEKRQARSAQFPADRTAPTGRPARGAASFGRPAPGATGKGFVAPAGATGKKTTPALTLKQAPGKPVGPALKGVASGKPGSPGPAPKGPISVKPGSGPTSGATGETLPLNKYIAHGGICSRRDAADLIRVGKVTVNGQTITEPGTKVLPTDTVKVNGKKVTISRNFVYILLNKPKDYITTTDDPQGRKTVLDLVRQATQERVFPVGRLDRNTSGVLLLTNDGDLAQKLAHPSHEIKKIYHVTLDKALTKADFDKIIGGEVKLEDGPALVDVLAYADPKDKTQIGLEIHSGRNRIVRRIFEHLGYDVRGLDRVMYAGLTKKNVQRGTWRLLTEKEIRILKYLNSSMKGSPARTKEWVAANADAHAYAKGTTGNVPVKHTTAPEKGGHPAAPATAATKAARPAAPAKHAAAAKPGKRPASSIPPKGRKPAGAATKPNPRRQHKPNKFNDDGE